MKEINGTITLAYVEEDNRQRVIFRVIPLCTREGGTFHGGAEEFPDEGSLRIVPDKREQSTFKERMREIGGLCVIHLANDGKELMKVRQNRNYAPDQGEKNQMAIYSDVLCEFAEDGCFEVIEAGADPEPAMTSKVLIHKDKMLYGPVEKQEAAHAKLDEMKPFGNDRFLLHTIETAQLGKHQIYWDPEATLNWRQRRNSLRRKERSQQDESSIEARAIENKRILDEKRKEREKQEALQEQPAQEAQPSPEDEKRRQSKAEKAAGRKAEKEKARQARAEQKPAGPVDEKAAETQPEEKEAESLPIGEKLDILDSALPFEQQISRLAQPLSETANRLSSDVEIQPSEEEPSEPTAHFNGTPLARNSSKPIRSKTRPENMHHVVEQQLQGQRDEVMGAELGTATYGMIRNPIESLRECLEYVWQNNEMRTQAMRMMMDNEGFVADMTDALRKNGINLQAYAAAQEQLAEIEAERLSLLMQLELAKENTRKYREEAVASSAQKKRDEIERLKNEIRQLETTRKKLTEANKALSSENAQQVTQFLSTRITSMGGAEEKRVLLSPVIGHEYDRHELAENLRVHMNDTGFSISEDDAMSLLISFSLYDALCLYAPTVQDAQAFAQVLLESFGLQSVSATVAAGASVEIASMLGENPRRTPTVSVQMLGSSAVTVYGHKTIYLTTVPGLPGEAEMMLPLPCVQVPPMLKRVFGQAAEWKPVEPAALSSFDAICADSHPMMIEAEKWFRELRHSLREENIIVPDVVLTCMRRFMEVASRKVRGGFLAAADIAVCHWIVPVLACSQCEREKILQTMAGLPRTLELLRVC
ncbi:MAG: hypothetical protein PUE14_01365 [Clostridia bacterium]|nr:hypothetical protein [Clostridia bacterium]